jgi:hypothetical protein
MIPQTDEDGPQERAVFQQDGGPPHFHTDMREFSMVISRRSVCWSRRTNCMAISLSGLNASGFLSVGMCER